MRRPSRTPRIPGSPHPWERIKIVQGGRRGYVPEATREYENRVAVFGKQAMAKKRMDTITEPVFVVAQFLVPRTREKHVFGGTLGGKKFITGSRPCTANARYRWPVRAEDGDLDNFLKAAKDGLVKGGVIADDRLIVSVMSWKEWDPDNQGRTLLIVYLDVPSSVDAIKALVTTRVLTVDKKDRKRAAIY